MRSVLIFGLPVVFSQRWYKEDLYSWEIQRLTRFSRFSRYLELLMKTIGLMHSSWRISSLLSPSSVASPWLSIHPLLTSSKSTCLAVWLLLTLTRELVRFRRCTTHTSTRWTRLRCKRAVAQIRANLAHSTNECQVSQAPSWHAIIT